MEISDIILLIILAPIIICFVIVGFAPLLGIGVFVLNLIVDEYHKLTDSETSISDKVFYVLRMIGLCYLAYVLVSYIINLISD